MAAPMEDSDFFGNDALFAAFEPPPEREADWDDEMEMEEREGNRKTTIDQKSGRKHTVFVDSDDSEKCPTKGSNDSGEKLPLNKTGNAAKKSVNGTNNQESAIPIDPACCVQIAFLNKNFAEKHKDLIKKFMTDLISNDAQDMHYSDRNQSSEVECFNFYTNFMIDPAGISNPNEVYETLLEEERPTYNQLYTKALPCESDSEEDEDACPQTRNNARKSSCWNCGGGHSLHECKEKKDHAKIAMNRAAFMAEKGGSNSAPQGDNRYHVEDDPRFQGFKAGQVSDSLREALGIRRKELPPYIYRMRHHGYPPGHLMEASLLASDISMFDKHGKEVSKEGESMEDGEVDEEAAKGGYDQNKIIEYPGFNVALDSGTEDYQDPPFNEFQLKSNLPRIFGADVFRTIDGLQRDKPSNQTDLESEDMDIATDTDEKHTSSGAEDSVSTGSLEQLEKQKQKILQSLEASTESTEPESTTETDATYTDTSDAESIQLSNKLVTPVNTRSRSVLKNLGTPIGVNSDVELPDPEKFRQNITEHIPYENLPNATGMFTKMMNVMGKVRDALTQMKK